jgi:hypothetical protein
MKFLPKITAIILVAILSLITLLPLLAIVQPVTSSPDIDQDGIPDSEDNCPDQANPDQLDRDKDGKGDLCDNCPENYNPLQEDFDKDGVGDDCDNCQLSNPDQEDVDQDGIGDECKAPDRDRDEIIDKRDNCLFIFNTDQADFDKDGIGDLCDNCPDIFNPKQEDFDEDGIGDACEEKDKTNRNDRAGISTLPAYSLETESSEVKPKEITKEISSPWLLKKALIVILILAMGVALLKIRSRR